jgi:RNA polymerase sigma-70 factor (ECF subfamily)
MDGSALANAELAERIQRGDTGAETELYARFALGLKQILLRATGNFAVAEELCQETLIIALKRLRGAGLEDPQRLPAFIAQIARNLAIAEQRKNRRRRTDTVEDSLDEVADTVRDERRSTELESSAQAVREVLQEMKSTRDRELLVRFYLNDEDKGAICRDLGVSEDAFNVILFRARKRLAELLGERGLKPRDLLCLALA